MLDIVDLMKRQIGRHSAILSHGESRDRYVLTPSAAAPQTNLHGTLSHYKMFVGLSDSLDRRKGTGYTAACSDDRRLPLGRVTVADASFRSLNGGRADDRYATRAGFRNATAGN